MQPILSSGKADKDSIITQRKQPSRGSIRRNNLYDIPLDDKSLNSDYIVSTNENTETEYSDWDKKPSTKRAWSMRESDKGRELLLSDEAPSQPKEIPVARPGPLLADLKVGSVIDNQRKIREPKTKKRNSK